MRVATEHDEQKALFHWAALQSRVWPKLRLLHAIPNGGQRNKIVAAKLKAEGVKKGVPDVCLPVPNSDHHGLYIEMKRKKGSYPTPQQREWIDALTRLGYRAVVCRGADEAIAEIKQYLGIGG